jgi:hypothetical protein
MERDPWWAGPLYPHRRIARIVGITGNAERNRAIAVGRKRVDSSLMLRSGVAVIRDEQWQVVLLAARGPRPKPRARPS